MKANSIVNKRAVLSTGATATMGESLRAHREMLDKGLRDAGHMSKLKKGETYAPGHIEDMYDDTVVFHDGTDLHAANYKIDGDKVAFSKKTPVERRTIYVPKGT